MSERKKNKTSKDLFIVSKKEKFPFGFIIKTTLLLSIVFVGFMAFIAMSMTAVNEDFSKVYTVNMNFEKQRVMDITQAVTNEDVSRFLTIYTQTQEKDFDKKMDIVIKKYNDGRNLYTANKVTDPQDMKKIRELSFVLQNSFWNYRFPNFSYYVCELYETWGMEPVWFKYARDDFFVNKTDIFVTDKYSPFEEIKSSRKKIQDAVDVYLNKKESTPIVRLVAQLNNYLGYPDYISERFLDLAKNSEAAKFQNIFMSDKSGAFSVSFDSMPAVRSLVYGEMTDKNISRYNGTMGVPTEKDNYLEQMWHIVSVK